MPIQVSCPCGKSLRLKDELAGMRVKCPQCGDAVDVPEVGEESNQYFIESEPAHSSREESNTSQRRPAGNTISGKPVSGYNGLYFPTLFGTSELTLGKTRLVEDTKKLLSSRYAEFILEDIESAEIVTHRNPLFLVLGLVTLVLYGLGLLFLAAYFLVKYNSLIIHSTSKGAVIGIKGDVGEYFVFLDEVLIAAERAKSRE